MTAADRNNKNKRSKYSSLEVLRVRVYFAPALRAVHET